MPKTASLSGGVNHVVDHASGRPRRVVMPAPVILHVPLPLPDLTLQGLAFIERERSGSGNCPLCDVAIEAVCISKWRLGCGFGS